MLRWLWRLGLLFLGGISLLAQPGGYVPSYDSDPAYDGRFTLVRLKWQGDGRSRGGWSTAWDHDYPRAEQHLSQILKELTALDMRTDGSRILTLDDPELFKFPIAFMWEPGFWTLTDTRGRGVPRLSAQGRLRGVRGLRRPFPVGELRGADAAGCCPKARFVKLDNAHRIFNSFFHDSGHRCDRAPDVAESARATTASSRTTIPSKRLMVVANFDNDVPEYWEWSGQGLFPFDASNEAYKLGVNYMIYGLTH